MKVLLVNKYHYFRGGSETYYFGLAELLERAGHKVAFFAMQDERNVPCEQSKYFVSNVEFNGELSVASKVKAGLHMVYSLEAKKKFACLLDDEKPDVIHINLFHRVLTASIVDEAKKRNIPVVFTMHDLNCICPNHTMLDHGRICEACLAGNYLNCVKRVCFKESRAKCLMAAVESEFNKISGLYNKFDLIITPSEFYMQLLEKSKLTRKPIIHMKNFLLFSMDYHVSPRGSYVFFYGRLSYEKGIFTLIRAMKNVDAELIIAGTGPLEAEIAALVGKENLMEKVRLVGFQKGNALQKYIEQAGCVVIPSEWYEASGYTACEAQAVGKPVVVADAGGLPENMLDGVTGLVFPMFSETELARKIQQILSLDDKTYMDMAEKSVLNAKKLFDADRYVERLLDEYQILIDKKRQTI